MFGLTVHISRNHQSRSSVEESEKMTRLECAEQELADLKKRATRAIVLLDERQRRNHWREAIEHMIQGAV